MKNLPKKILHRIYNPIDNSPVSKEESNPEMLENGLDTYDVFTWFVPSSNLVDDGIEYNNAHGSETKFEIRNVSDILGQSDDRDNSN